MDGLKSQVPQLMDIPDASEYFGISQYYLRKGVRSGKIPISVQATSISSVLMRFGGFSL